ncbi:MAG TPA: hypothetical protein VGD62_10380, partial [Acidobacteriaceae bacterium]
MSAPAHGRPVAAFALLAATALHAQVHKLQTPPSVPVSARILVEPLGFQPPNATLQLYREPAA